MEGWPWTFAACDYAPVQSSKQITEAHVPVAGSGSTHRE